MSPSCLVVDKRRLIAGDLPFPDRVVDACAPFVGELACLLPAEDLMVQRADSPAPAVLEFARIELYVQVLFLRGA